MAYDLHLILNEKLLLNLRKISKIEKTKSISGTIVAIFNRLSPVLKKYQAEFQNRKSRYKLVANLKEKRHNFHVYFPEEMYMKIKVLHEYLNFYSMAQIVREVLQLYLKEFFSRKPYKTRKKIISLHKRWNAWRNKHKIIMRDKYDKIVHTIVVTYDKNYIPVTINFKF